ncbi:alpha/beta fold hydrolase [Gemmobacter lutimaris]|uniref:alpha/beta fold hydrolase n=1 Tax=Gemmobacter lutimaris TaxID=2306023 RepID=UPI001F399B94|nr:alpha/beta hydrolase [Gemmobacter lutimaris]
MLESLIAGSALVALGAFGTRRRAARREARRKAAFPPLGRLVTVEGRRLHLVQIGSGPDLVMIHGASANLREFAMDLAPRLSSQFRVTLIDRPGLGWSDAVPEDTPGEQARLMRLAAESIGVTRPLVLGHSYGGAVALAWAMQAPVAGLLMLSGVAMPWEGGLGLWYQVTASAMGRAVVVPLVTAFAPTRQIDRSIAATFLPQQPPPGYSRAAGVGLLLRRDALAHNARQVNTLLPHVQAMQPHYDTIRVPVEILHGDADTIVPAHIHAVPLAATLPDAALTLLPGLGHMPHQTQPEAVKAAALRLAARAGLRLD